MTSLKAMCSFLGVAGRGDQISVIRDFFGFEMRRVPSVTGAPNRLSLLTQMKALRGPQFNVNLIKVGSDHFGDDDNLAVDAAVHKARVIYAEAGLGIGRVLHFFILEENADGHHVITSNEEARNLTRHWSVDNDGIDIFFVQDYVGAAGFCCLRGRCDRKNTVKMSGAVLDVSRGQVAVARTFAHEIGHFLGLSHRNSDPNNLMCQSDEADGLVTSVQLSDYQEWWANTHCSIHSGYSGA